MGALAVPESSRTGQPQALPLRLYRLKRNATFAGRRFDKAKALRLPSNTYRVRAYRLATKHEGNIMAISAETIEKAEVLLREQLELHFQEQFTFDPIIIEPDRDHYGDECLDITVVFDGDGGRLDPRKLISIGTNVAFELECNMGLIGVSGLRYIEKSEYPEWLELTDPANWMAELMDGIELA